MHRLNDMDTATAIDALCAHYGVAIRYADADGVVHEVPRATRQALLHAQGVSCATERDCAAALAAAAAESWQTALPPVQVVRGDAPQLDVFITLPAGAPAAPWHWSLTLENNAQQHGSFDLSQLAVMEQRVIERATCVRYRFSLPKMPPPGYHRFTLQGAAKDDACNASMSLIVAPRRCYQPAAIRDGQRRWGLATQLYALRSARNWGIGDFTDGLAIVEQAAQYGAAFVGLSPLHALYPQRPEQVSPYSPSSRLFFNVLFIDIEAVEDCREANEIQALLQDSTFQAQLRALRAADLVDYAGVARIKLEWLERLFTHFSAHHLAANTPRAQAWRSFCKQRGNTLHRQTCFDALQAHFQQTDAAMADWSTWPDDYRQSDSAAVRDFATRHAGQLDFFAYVYWQAELQLAGVGARCLERNLGVGLYVDLALGSDRQGADVWANQGLFALDIEIGAPPDAFNPGGQAWGLPPLLPQQLRRSGYQYFIELLRSNMRDAGALRIDHVMGLMRQYWIPAGGAAPTGGYVAYPFEDLLGIVALESQRNRCLIVGEDLGTVPAGLRATLQEAGVLCHQLLYFSQDADGSFIAPTAYPHQALATTGTHDLPTLAGFWNGSDLDLCSSLQLFADDKVRQDRIVRRVQDRARLLMALESNNLLPPDHSVYPNAPVDLTTELVAAIYRYLARTPSALLALRLDDVFAQTAQANLPGSGAAYPNWRTKLALNIEEWTTDGRLRQISAAIHAERTPKTISAELAERTVPAPALSIPRATYRLQFNHAFTFRDATALVPYLAKLGISHCYASPFLKARPGSLHGYDIVDHLSLNPEMGGVTDFDTLVDTLHRHDMGLIMDVVPNHMAVMGSDNAWWLDVLENGQASLYADCFDIDWDSYQHNGGHKVLLPVLGDHYARVLDRGELRVNFSADSGEFFLSYYAHRFPLDPREYPRILAARLELLNSRLAADDPQALAFQSLMTAFGHLPARSETSPDKTAERVRDKEIHKRNLAKLYARNADIAAYIDEQLADLNREPGDGTSVERLHELIGAQAYRLAYWRVASDEINYRRFFDINDLAALRMENARVFAATHALVFELLDQGKISGLRIDHPDGLYDPLEYFTRLQQRYGGVRADAPSCDRLPVYIVIEKILAENEQLPAHWPVHGTTGYDFANLLNGLFIDAAAAEKMQRVYNAFTGEHSSFDDIVYHSKIIIMRGALASELNVLANQLSRIAQADRYTCDYTLNNLRRALTEVVACFPVYRSYVDAAGAAPSDLQVIDTAIRRAKKRSQAADISIFDFLHEVLNTRIAEGKAQNYRDAVMALARKFQQYTAPVTAKGVEDTSFYRYHRLVSLNEVGGDPRRFGCSVPAFHDANLARRRDWPHSLLATSTHDTKRSEDLRARINVLSERVDEWRRCLARWHRMNQRKKSSIDGNAVPDNNEEYFIYQTLLGIWPDIESVGAVREQLCERLEAYLQKALREAKLHSAWINPNGEYEAATAHFIRAILAPDNRKFQTEFSTFQRVIAWFGMLNSLAQVILKLTAPGVPDIYQGNEAWDFSLVDPDNRRPVDYPRRRAALEIVEELGALPAVNRRERLSGWFESAQNDLLKMYFTWQTLRCRREQAALFRDGDYLPLACRGAHAAHLCAFARRHAERMIIVVVPRLSCTLLGGAVALPVGVASWGDTVVELPLPAARWTELFTDTALSAVPAGEASTLPVAELFSDVPFALLKNVTR